LVGRRDPVAAAVGRVNFIGKNDRSVLVN